MTTRVWSMPLRAAKRALAGSRGGEAEEGIEAPAHAPAQAVSSAIDMAPDDPLVARLEHASGAIDVDSLELDSPALRELRQAGVKLVVPLISQGELIGVLNLGPRLSAQEYSGDDTRLLQSLAAQAAPALRIGQLVREQETEARARERIEQELQVAQLIQQNFLPKDLPELRGWHVAAHYRPAREVGGDFYDFIALPGDRLGLVIGDVTDKGVPAAMVMAATRSMLRASAPRLVSPGQVLGRVNELLCPDVPEKMFVTCLYAVLDPGTGTLQYANAGHDLPYVRRGGEASELRATGLPLGLFPGITYEEMEATIEPGESLLLSSDGLAEAHSERGEMFGFPRIKALVGSSVGGSQELIDALLVELHGFTPTGWEQEDDITIVALHRPTAVPSFASSGDDSIQMSQDGDEGATTLVEFEVASAPGNERAAIDRVAEAVNGVDIPSSKLERLKTAVGEATMNAMEHGNEFRADRPVAIRVRASAEQVSVTVTDHGGGAPIRQVDEPDLDAKLAGEQPPRGWGLFLIERMVDEMRVTSDERHHAVELTMNLSTEPDGPS
jgi:serine phosphatase RsbU (regulator of sigma subunit)/anti-sigma regulatory factor (Ser/Thr protein kinase)